MSETSGFFADNNGDRAYTDTFLADFVHSFIGDGVFNGDLAVTAGQNMTVVIPAGQAFIKGYRYYNDGNLVLTIANADGVLKRKDVVVLRWDINARSITVQVLTGTFSSSPVAPAIVRSAEQYDLKLAEIDIPAGATSIAQVNITDYRLNTSVCGIVTSPIDHLDTQALYQQLTDSFNTWFASMKGQLSNDAAGNLQTEIDNIVSGLTKTGKAGYAETSGNVAQQMDIIDGNFQVSSIGAAFDTNYNGAIGYKIWDTWKMDVNVEGYVQRKKVTPGDIPGSTYFCRLGIGSALTRGQYISTFIEKGASDLCSYPKLTLSFYARASMAGSDLLVHPSQNYGTGGNTNDDNWLRLSGISTVWKRYSLTFSPVSIVGKTVAEDNYLLLSFYMDSTVPQKSAANYVDFTQVQIDVGEIALPYRNKTFEQELHSCQRYFYALNYSDLMEFGIGAIWLSGSGGVPIRFPVTMRVTPTGTCTGTFYALCNAAYYSPTAMNASNSNCSKDTALVSVTAAGLPAGYAFHLIATGSACIKFDSRY